MTGNPDLEPETSRQFDMALRFNRGPLRLAAFAYLYLTFKRRAEI